MLIISVTFWLGLGRAKKRLVTALQETHQSQSLSCAAADVSPCWVVLTQTQQKHICDDSVVKRGF